MNTLKLTAVMALVFGLAAAVSAEVKMGIAVNNRGLNSFYLSVGNYHRVPEKEVIAVKQRGIPDEELSAVFFIAAKAGVHHDEIIKLRIKKWSWMRIAQRYRIDPAVFYVPVKTKVVGKVYGRPYSYYAKPQARWKHIRLNDADIVNCVNLRFITEHYGYDPDEVIKMRESGKNFITINNDINIERARKIAVEKKKLFWVKKKYDKKHSGRYDDQKRELEDNDYDRKDYGIQEFKEGDTDTEKYHGKAMDDQKNGDESRDDDKRGHGKKEH